MTSWRESWHYDSVGYSPTVLNTRFRRSNHYYYGLYERYSDIKHYRYLRELALSAPGTDQVQEKGEAGTSV